ncbi:MAG: AgmX/PglI C-terminal domain-containing protein [Myxococcales bacterium]|nr:AgmX/PglI C-terminal domain-containing protein [Myxococcales bacterium]
MEIEPPYKLGERPTARTTAAYKREIAELRHWGKGGTGELLAAAPGVDGHPDPRVTVNVVGATGPHKISEIQRLSRRNHWINVIRCYRLGAYLDPNLRGWTKAVIDIQKTGNVKATQLLETELLDPAVAACIVEKLRGLKFSAQRQGTRASFEIRVSPGDEPMPPPTELIVPGDGQLAPEKILAVVDAALPRIEACFAAALAYAPGLWGRMLLRMHLSEQGKLDEVFEAGTQFPDPRTSQCVVHAARKLKFPKPEGGELRFVVGLRFFSDASAHALPIVPPPRSP